MAMVKRMQREAPDRRVGGMSEAEKGKGKLHMLHEGEIVLNRPTTKRLLDVLGLSKDTAMKMAPASLMKKVKEVIDIGKRGMNKDKGTPEPMKKTPSRMKGGMSAPVKRVKRTAPARRKGGMSAADHRAEMDKKAGRLPRYDTL